MAWEKKQTRLSIEISSGNLNSAVAMLKKKRRIRTKDDPELRRHLTAVLTAALIQRADRATLSGNLKSAWIDLTNASDIAELADGDKISRQKNQLVELTIETADAMLAHGKTTSALHVIGLLDQRDILDWRADRIRNVASLIQASDELEAQGKIADAILKLETANNLLPDLTLISSKINGKQVRKIQLSKLTGELRRAALKCHWIDVGRCCQKILLIAPKYEIALAAQRLSREQISRDASGTNRKTQVPKTTTVHDSFFKSNSRSTGSGKRQSALNLSTQVEKPHDPNHAIQPRSDTFVLWVDGVGGYLVCPDSVNIIGQAIDQANISIPIMGDLHRRHVRIESMDGRHVIDPLANLCIDNRPIVEPIELKHMQTLELEGGVRFKYTQSHPLSKTARLDFVSRHRTQPWSDGVLLAAQSIILGPNPNNHVHCPTWTFDLVLFRRQGKWACRAQEPFEIDGHPTEKQGELQLDSRITGKDYSLTLEPI